MNMHTMSGRSLQLTVVATVAPRVHTHTMTQIRATAAPIATGPSFFGMSRDRLRTHMMGYGLPAFRAEQVYSWVYQKHVRHPHGMTNLPASFRDEGEGMPGRSLSLDAVLPTDGR